MKKRVVTALALVLALVLAPVSSQLTMAAEETANQTPCIAGCTCGECTVSGNQCTCGASCSGNEGVSCNCGSTPTPTPTPSTKPDDSESPSPSPSTKPGDSESPSPSPSTTPAPTQNPGNTGSGNNTVVTPTPTPAPSNNSNSSSSSTTPAPEGIVVAEDGMYENVPESNWAEVNNSITAAVAAATVEGAADAVKNVDVVVGRTVEVPAAVLNTLAGTDVTLALHIGQGLALSITGTDVAATEVPFNMNMVASTVPAEVKDAVLAAATGSYEFSFEEQGAFAFRVNMHMNFGAENVGKLAVLYRYDEATGALVVAGTFVVNADGQAMFGLEQGGQYIAVVSDSLATYTVVAGDTFGRIAQRHNMTTAALKAANPDVKNINKIRVGQVLNVY